MTSSFGALRRAAVAVVAVAVVAALGAAMAAPAGALSDPEEWGDTFCTGTVGWLGGAQAGAEQLATQSNDPSLTPAAGRALIVEYLTTGVDATKEFGQSLKQAGAPKIANGAKIQASILAGITGSGVALAALLKLAKALPTGSQKVFDRAASKLGDRLSSFSDPFSKSLAKADKLDEGNQLGGILESLPSCAALSTVG